MNATLSGIPTKFIVSFLHAVQKLDATLLVEIESTLFTKLMFDAVLV
jgi:hypothetical protein